MDGSIGSIDIANGAEPAVTPDEACAQHLGPQLRKVAIAVRALWPDGRVPAILGVRERDRRIWEWCEVNGLQGDELPSKATLYRFFRSKRTERDVA